MGAVSLLVPQFDHPAIEERYATRQSELLLRRSCGAGTRVVRFSADDATNEVAQSIEGAFALVVTDPIVIPAPDLVQRLAAALETSEAFAAVPLSNESPVAEQRGALPRLYQTLRQFEDESRSASFANRTIVWPGGDFGVALVAVEQLRRMSAPLHRLLDDQSVVIAGDAAIHRWSSHRGQPRPDVLARIPHDVRDVLEIGCGEGTLGAALKERQPCRVVGIEIDEAAAAIARERLDEVHVGDAPSLLGTLGDRFDCIVGGDVIEHLVDPWSMLESLRRVSRPSGRLVLSLPNVASWPIVSDLLLGRFDYIYLGILCAGHVRLFTRSSISDMLEMSGWREVAIEAQEPLLTDEATALFEKLRNAGIEHSLEDLTAPGWYVVAENPR